MTKQEIISWIRGFTVREDQTARMHERWLIAVIEDVLKEMYGELYKATPKLLDLYTKSYGTTTAVTVIFDSANEIYYSTLPATIINLPSKSSGVLHIYPKVNTGNIFHPMDSREADLVFNTDIGTVTTKIGYKVKTDSANMRVEYYNMNTTVRDTGVRMDLLIPFSVYSDTDIVLIPDPVTKEGTTFKDRVLTALQVVPPAELIDANAAPKEQPKQR